MVGPADAAVVKRLRVAVLIDVPSALPRVGEILAMMNTGRDLRFVVSTGYLSERRRGANRTQVTTSRGGGILSVDMCDRSRQPSPRRVVAIAAAAALAGSALVSSSAALAGEAAPMKHPIHWLGHDSFRVDGPPVVYFDPFRLGNAPPQADVILITHDHFDHCSPEDVAKIRGPKTVVAGPREIAAKLPGPVTVLAAGETKKLGGIEIRAIPAYNTNKKFHPQQDGKLGFVVKVGGTTYYHAGDTDRIPEMDGLAPTIALLPVSGTYVMTADEAAAAARAIKPKVVIPMHYGSIIGNEADAQRLAQLLSGSGIDVVVKTKE